MSLLYVVVGLKMTGLNHMGSCAAHDVSAVQFSHLHFKFQIVIPARVCAVSAGYGVYSFCPLLKSDVVFQTYGPGVIVD